MGIDYLLIILVILTGFFLILLDIALIPGGVVGAVGGIFIILTLIYSYKTQGRLFALNVSLTTLLTGAALGLLVWRFRLWSFLQHKEIENRETGYSAVPAYLDTLIGQEGKTLNTLRPSGSVRIGERKYDCIAQGGMIGARVKVQVVAISGAQLIVKSI